MGTDTKRRKMKRLKGSVLFTTLVVMILILLIMLAAIGLAGAASKKAYSTWYDNQTKYTAQDLVDNVIQTLGKDQDNETLGSSIVTTLRNGGKGTKVDVDVNLSGGNSTIPGYGTVESLTFEHAGINGTNFRMTNGHDKDIIIKVSAAVRMGGETSTYSTYCIGNSGSNKTNANGGGYIALADLKGGSGSNDAPGTIGRFYAGIDSQMDSSAGGNNTINAGDVFINTKKYTFNSACNTPAGIILGRNDPKNGYYGGMRITGDLVAENALIIQSQYPPKGLDDLSGEKFYNIPYLYVDGQIQSNTQGLSLAKFDRDGDGTDDSIGMLNVYCDTIAIKAGGDFANLVKDNGNMNFMLMGEKKTSTFKMDTSTLTDWASQTVTGVTNKGNMHSGNIYCKGSLNLTGSGKTLEVNGDLLVVGDLTTSGTITVNNGDVYVGGSINGTVTVNSGELKGDLGASGSTATFLQKVKALDPATNPHAAAAAGRFETAFTLKDGDTDLVQTLDNIKGQFVDADNNYVGVIKKSDYADNIEWDGKPNAEGKYVITDSCMWKSTTTMKKFKDDGSIEKSCAISDNSGEFKTIYINPPPNKEIWINIDSSLSSINGKEIIIDDSNGGSVKFFIEKGAAGHTITMPMTKIITKTYYDMFYGGGTIPKLSSYPEDSKYIPHVYIYAAPDNDVTIEAQSGNYMFTCDIIAPKATFRALSDNGNSQTIDYTYFNYIDTNGDKKVDSSDLTNPVRENRTINNLAFIGSLETGCIDVTNQFGYLYVDDPPFDGKDKGLTDDFSWTNIDGYSTY